jgi:hypothetical protein
VAFDQLREWYITTVSPLLREYSLAQIRDATELSTRYVITIRHGAVPHPRHYLNLAALVGVELPATYTAASSRLLISRLPLN